MKRTPEVVEEVLGSIILTYSQERPFFPIVTPTPGRGGVDSAVLETTKPLGRLLALRAQAARSPLNLPKTFLQDMITHQSEVLEKNGAVQILESLTHFYRDIAFKHDGF